MNEMMNVGILDTVVDSDLTSLQVGNSVFLNDFEKPIRDITHGTVCALILTQYIDKADIKYLTILNKNGRGFVSEIDVFLQKCLDKAIVIINMSFGTTHFLDKTYIKNTINHYANKGLIIVAASSNDGFTTYPSSLSNVISVACGDEFCVDEKLQRQKGIDFIAPSDHEIIIEGASFRLGRSNSYAAPYVTAMVGNLICEKGMMTVNEIRHELAPHKEKFIYSPDWIERAWVSPECHRNNVGFYFEEDRRTLRECINYIDTLILCSPDEIEKYADFEKNIVYLGTEEVKVKPDIKYHFWSASMRRKQVVTSPCKNDDFNIPVVCCMFDDNIDRIYCLCEMKKLFADDGYNAYSGCELIEAPLYDLEFLPPEKEVRGKLTDFIYWQTYYQQSDIVLIGMDCRERFITIQDNTLDMLIEFKSAENHVCVDITFESIHSVSRSFQVLDLNAIIEIYRDIINNFEKEDS